MLVSIIEQYGLKEATIQVTEMVNFIKTWPLKSRIIELLCKDMNFNYVRLLLHTEDKLVIKRERTISSNWGSERTSFFLKMKNLMDFVNTIKMNCGCLK